MTPNGAVVPRVRREATVRRLWTIVEGIEGAVVLAVTILGAPVLRHAFNRWRTTKGEGRAPMDGDGLVSAPRLGYTRAISIDAPPEAVWPWLAQIGQGRGGLYSYDALENLIGCDIHSADTILDDCSEPEVGDLVRLGPDGYPTFRVARVEPPRSLVLVGVDPASNEPPPEAAARTTSPAITWSWRLKRRGARGTRLVTRQRLTFPPTQSTLWHLIEPVTFVMERKMLLGIKKRAERAAGTSASPRYRGSARL
jgi:hypothetical protein